MPPPAKLLIRLKRAEDEIQRLKLRHESRTAPYYKVIKEFFPQKFEEKFVDPNDICSCNICGKNIEDIKMAAVKKAINELKAQ